VNDSKARKVASSQEARDEIVLRDLERDLRELEEQYGMPSEEFLRRWQAGELADSADFMDWNALYQMANSVRATLLSRTSTTGGPVKRPRTSTRTG
jgi:hypothetical protein